MKGLRVRFEGLTASYPYPFLRSGTALSMPLPPYSSIFGMLSACAGRDIRPDGHLLIGFEFISGERPTLDLERTDRLKTDPKTGRLRQNPEQGIAKREFLIDPHLDVYMNDVQLEPIFERPITTPRFGRSQDLAWIKSVQEIELEPVSGGSLHATLVPYQGQPIGQVLPPLVDYYINDIERQTRVPGKISRYVALPNLKGMAGFPFRAASQLQLYHPSDSTIAEHAIVLMDFQT